MKGFRLKFFPLTAALVFSSALSLDPPPAPDSDGHKYDLEIQKVDLVNETDYVVFEGLKVKRYNKTCKDLYINLQKCFKKTFFLKSLCC